MEISIGVCRKSRKLFKVFDVIEIQETFYNIPKRATVERWAKEAGSTELTFKAFQGLTHEASSPTWRRFRGELKEEEKKLVGSLKLNELTKKWIDEMVSFASIMKSPIIVIQTPAKMKMDNDSVKRIIEFFSYFADKLKEMGLNTLLGWEPRGKWLANNELLRKVFGEIDKLIHIVDPFFHKEVIVKEIVYFRLHGKPYLNYKYSYTDEDFKVLLNEIDARKEAGAKKIYVLFNNVKMVDDALRFKRLMG